MLWTRLSGKVMLSSPFSIAPALHFRSLPATALPPPFGATLDAPPFPGHIDNVSNVRAGRSEGIVRSCGEVDDSVRCAVGTGPERAPFIAIGESFTRRGACGSERGTGIHPLRRRSIGAEAIRGIDEAVRSRDEDDAALQRCLGGRARGYDNDYFEAWGL